MAEQPVELSPRAWRDIERLPAEVADEILRDLEVLAKPRWPGPPKVKKLRGHDLYRLRTGEYRSVFELQQEKVVVLRIVGRKELERILRSI